MVCYLSGSPRDVAITEVALQYVTTTVAIVNGQVQLNCDISQAYRNAMGKLNRTIDELQTKYRAPEGSSFFSSRAFDIWNEIATDLDASKLVQDVRVLSSVMHLRSVPKKLVARALDPRDGLLEAHNHLMQRLELYSSSYGLHTTLDQIASNSKLGLSILDPKQVQKVRFFLEQWKEFLKESPSHRHNVEFVERFDSLVKVGDCSFINKVYFHVWDQACKAGENPQGDNWGEVNAFTHIERLLKAIDATEDEYLEQAREFHADSLKLDPSEVPSSPAYAFSTPSASHALVEIGV